MIITAPEVEAAERVSWWVVVAECSAAIGELCVQVDGPPARIISGKAAHWVVTWVLRDG
jgi:hypothetical protein